MLLTVNGRKRLPRPVQPLFHAVPLSNGLMRLVQRYFAPFAPCPAVIQKSFQSTGLLLMCLQKCVARRRAQKVTYVFIHARALHATALVLTLATQAGPTRGGIPQNRTSAEKKERPTSKIPLLWPDKTNRMPNLDLDIPSSPLTTTARKNCRSSFGFSLLKLKRTLYFRKTKVVFYIVPLKNVHCGDRYADRGF